MNLNASRTEAICPGCGKRNRFDPKVALEKNALCGSCGKSLGWKEGVLELSGAQLLDLLMRADLPVVVDFWAPWCGPCRVFAPTFQSVAKSWAGRFIFVKLNTEAHPDAASRFSIRSIPTLAKFRGGRELARVSGALPRAELEAFLEQS